MTDVLRILPVLTLALTVSSAAGAQSLGDVAKKEEARRKAAARPGKVYTNDNLRGGDAAAPPPAPAQAPPSPSSAQAKPGEDAKTDAAAEPKKDEAHWRGRMTEARNGLERAKTFQEALQTRINSLSNDFASRDDPAQRSVVAANRQKALAELDRVTKEIADYEKQIVSIEDEARRAGVPPGWLR
jgi:hypothetical protein